MLNRRFIDFPAEFKHVVSVHHQQFFFRWGLFILLNYSGTCSDFGRIMRIPDLLETNVTFYCEMICVVMEVLSSVDGWTLFEAMIDKGI